MKYPIIALILIAVGVITFGNAMAATFNESVFVNGLLKVTGNFVVDRPDASSSITVRNAGDQSVIQLADKDTGEAMNIRLITSGKRLDFAIVGVGVPIVIDMSNQNVGIGGQLAPSEALDIIGNVKVSGDLKLVGSITSSDGSDICIGNCP